MAKDDEIADLREEVSILRKEVRRLRDGVVESSDIPDGAIHEGEPPIVLNRWIAETTTRTQACCYLSTPEHVRSFVGTFLYIYTDKGQLTLAEDYLRFTGKNQTPIEIALERSEKMSVYGLKNLKQIMEQARRRNAS